MYRFKLILNISKFLEVFCTYEEGSGNGVEKIKVNITANLQTCANECFQMKRDENAAINGATVDKKKCYCEVQQTHRWFTKEKMNCFFKTGKKKIIEGEFSISFLIRT